MHIVSLNRRVHASSEALTELERQLAEYFLEHPVRVAFWPANKFARAVGVSEATVVRFARSLGYENYGELQREVQTEVEHSLRDSIPARLDRSLEGPDNDHLETCIEQDLQNLRECVSVVDAAHFSKAVEALAETAQLYVIGLRASEPIAGFAAYAFNLLVPEVITLTRLPETHFETLLRMRPGACMLAVAYARNSRRTIQLADAARRRGCFVIVLTDSPLAPIATRADALIVIPTESPSFIQALAATFSVLNALILAVSTRRGGEAAERMREMERLLLEHDVVLSTGQTS